MVQVARQPEDFDIVAVAVSQSKTRDEVSDSGPTEVHSAHTDPTETCRP